MSLLTTPVTQLLKIKHPILLAGMGRTSGPEMVAAVSNAGGLGVIGGIGYTPEMLKEMIADVKANLRDPSTPFGVDLLLPQVGGSARKTNVDYTRGQLDELIDIIIEGGVSVFVSAVGVPPKEVVDKLHAAGVLYMNIIGHPKLLESESTNGLFMAYITQHVHKACQIGADLICAQGGEAGGHTGEIPTSILIPACADICKTYKSSFTGQPVQLIAAGGIFDGRSIASTFMLGANAVWVGTRFVTARESLVPDSTKQEIIQAGFDSTIKSTIWTGRPLRALATPYVRDWEQNRAAEIAELQKKGIIVLEHELDKLAKENKLTEEIEDQSALKNRPMGYASAMVNKANQSAGEIVLEMVMEAYNLLKGADRFSNSAAKL